VTDRPPNPRARRLAPRILPALLDAWAETYDAALADPTDRDLYHAFVLADREVRAVLRHVPEGVVHAGRRWKLLYGWQIDATPLP
jgi:hypothetical protein